MQKIAPYLLSKAEHGSNLEIENAYLIPSLERAAQALKLVLLDHFVKQRQSSWTDAALNQIPGVYAGGRPYIKRLKTYRPGNQAPSEFHRHRFK